MESLEKSSPQNMAVRKVAAKGLPHGVRFTTETETFRDWLRQSRHGHWACYWHGDLANDRERPPRGLPEQIGTKYRERADSVGRAAWMAQARGSVMLFQLRSAVGWYYLAMRTRR